MNELDILWTGAIVKVCNHRRIVCISCLYDLRIGIVVIDRRWAIPPLLISKAIYIVPLTMQEDDCAYWCKGAKV